MSSHHCNYRAVIKLLFFTWLPFAGSTLIAQQEEPKPASPITATPHKSNEAPDDSELKIRVYPLKHAQAADVLKLFKQLHGDENGFAIDERTNSIVFLARESAATELLETFTLLDGETPSLIIPPTPVAQGSALAASVPENTKPAGQFRKYTFRHAKAVDVLKILRKVAGSDFNDDMEGFVVDERTNSFIWKIEDVSLDFQEECRKLDIESPEEEVQIHNLELYGRVPVIGPPTKGGAPIALDPPSDDEVLHALERARPTRGGLPLPHGKRGISVWIVKEKIADYVDPPQFVPLIGMAQLHHAHYKCTIYFSERTDKDTNEVIYIDHNHFHICDNDPVPGPLAAQASQTFNFSIGFEHGESLESLKRRYSELEQQTHQLAHKFKQSRSTSETERKELQAAVRKSFEARQALQRAELADLAGRMKSMQQSIDMRDKLADKVIERRVEDLLNPNLKWDLLSTKDRTLDGHNSDWSDGSATTAQSAPNTPALTPVGSASLPKSMAPAPTSVPYDPGKRPETIIMERIQGHWVAESMLSAGKDSLKDLTEPFEVLIDRNEMRFRIGTQDLHGPMLLTRPNVSNRSHESADQPLPIDIVMDPNGKHREMPGIIACDGSKLSLCFADRNESQKNGFRPTSFIPGSKVVVLKCYRLTPTVPGKKPIDADLSTPQATLDYLHRYSLAHPGGFPAECYTDGAILELSGLMLQNLSMMSAMSQVPSQTSGVIGESNGVPTDSGTSPPFHIRVERLLKEQTLPTPPESADKAFETLATLTFGSKSSNAASSVQVDRQLLRLAAGVLKSPIEFLPAASKLLETFGETDADVTKSTKADQTQPQAEIAINGHEATATFISSGKVASTSPLTSPRITKLRRIDGRWLISEILTDEEITQLQSSYSSVMDQLGAKDVASDIVPEAGSTIPD